MSAKKQTPTKKPAPVVKPSPKAKRVPEPGPSFFDNPGKKAFYLFAGILVLIGVIVFADYLFFHRVYLFKDIASDAMNESYPIITATAIYLKKYHDLSWSFNIGMGQDLTQIAFGDPFNNFLYLFSSHNIAYLFGWKEVFKIWSAGLIFFAYLRILGKGTFASSIGGLMFAFSGYVIVGGQWHVYSFDAANSALLLLGFELLYKKNNPWLFPVPVVLLGINYPFNLALLTMFLFIYAIFRYLQDNREGVKDLLALFLKMGALGLIGLIISSPALAGNLRAMFESARASGSNSLIKSLSSAPIFAFPEPLQLGTCVARFFSSDMLGTGDAYKGLGNYFEGPMFYSSIPCLLLTPLLFLFLEKREKRLFGALLALWFLPIIFPFFRRAFWLFTGDYYRTFSFYISFIFIFFSVTCLDRIGKEKKLNPIILIGIAIFLIVIQMLPYFDSKNALNANIASAAKIYVLAYAVILFWMSRQKSDVPKFAFLALLITELTWFSSVSVDRNTTVKSSEWEAKLGYNDYSIEALAFIKSRENSFYRVDKSYGSSPAEFRSLNDALLQDYYSTTSYNSFNQKYYLQYMVANKIISPTNETESRWCPGLVDRPILQSLNSDKYILSKQTMYGPNDPIHDSIAKFGDVIVYKNKFPMPLGICYDIYIKYSDFDKFSLTQRDFSSCHAAVVNDADTGLVKNLKQMHLRDSLMPSSFSVPLLTQYFNELRKDTLTITSFNPAHIKGQIALKTDKIMYLSIPFDIGWHLNVDGKPQTIILLSNGMIGVLLSSGNHNITLDYEPLYRKEGGLAAIGGLLLYGGVVFGSYRMRKRAKDKQRHEMA